MGNEDDGSVSIIDTGSRKVVRTISVAGSPGPVVAAPNGKKVYVPCHGSGLSVIDTATGEVTKSAISGL